MRHRPVSDLAAPARDFLAEAGALLRPGGRLLVIHDYGRDDDCGVCCPSSANAPWRGVSAAVRSWATGSGSRHPLLVGLRVDRTGARDARRGLWPMGVELAVKMKRLRLEYSIAIYQPLDPGRRCRRGVRRRRGGRRRP